MKHGGELLGTSSASFFVIRIRDFFECKLVAVLQ